MIIGEIDKRSGDTIANLYSNVNAEIFRNEIKVAEMVKYSCNAFHALKITFANEVGNICKNLGIDSHKVMDIFSEDRSNYVILITSTIVFGLGINIIIFKKKKKRKHTQISLNSMALK